MPAATTIAIIAGAAALAGTGYQIYQSEKQSSEAAKQREEQKKQQDKLLQDERDRQALEQASSANQAASAALRRQSRQSAPAFGGTVLTNPLGSIGTPNRGGKTLLGA